MGKTLQDFNELFSTYYKRYVRFAYSYLRDESLSEDVVMESMIYYWENRLRLEGSSNVPAYILTTIKHKCLNLLKRQANQRKVSSNMKSLQQWELSTRIATLEACEPDMIFSNEVKEIATKAFATLPDSTKKVFKLSRLEQKSHSEIALSMKMSVKGVEYHITKANKCLKEALKDYFPMVVAILSLDSFI